MKVYVDEENRIKAVGSTDDETLTELIIADDPENPFRNMSAAKICCFVCTVENEHVTMLTPYRATSTFDYIEELGRKNEELTDKAMAADILMGLVEVEE